MDPGIRTGVNESPQPARLGRGLDHETHQAHSRADHPQAQDRRAADRPGQDRRRRLPRDRGEAPDLPPLETAIRGGAGRGGPLTDTAGEGNRPGPTGLVRGQRYHQHGLQRAWIPVGERLCRVLQREAPRRVPQCRAVEELVDATGYSLGRLWRRQSEPGDDLEGYRKTVTWIMS